MDVYQSVTDNIVAALEADPGNPLMPWHRGGANQVPVNVFSKSTYNGINILNLWVTAQAKAYTSELWGTYKQWKEAGAQVRKGEKSSIIIFYKKLKLKNDDGEDEERHMIRASWGFNADQVDDFDRPDLDGEPIDRIALADAMVSATGAEVVNGGVSACYRPDTDTIHMPDEERFFDTKPTLDEIALGRVHLLGHWPKALAETHRNDFTDGSIVKLILDDTLNFVQGDKRPVLERLFVSTEEITEGVCTLMPGHQGENRSHPGEKIIFALTGRLNVYLPDTYDWFELHEKDALYLPANTVHQCWNYGDTETSFAFKVVPNY